MGSVACRRVSRRSGARGNDGAGVYFFFSSRRRHTRYWRDWSSDVCSSDLVRSASSASTTRSCRRTVPRSAGWSRRCRTSCASKKSEERLAMTLKVHHLRPAPGAHTPKTRVGRGEGSKGKTAGRGTKGTGARGNTSARFEGGQTPLHMRLPKLSGFKNNNKVVFQVVNLDRIAALFPQGGPVDPDTLAEAGAVRRGQPVKVLGTGDLGGVKVDIQAHAFSASAAEKIGAAGGSTTRI